MTTAAKKVSTLTDQIRKQPFWEGLDQRHLPLLVEGATVERFGAGDLIAREGQPADRFYLVLRGQVALEATIQKGDTVTVETVGPGAALGWSWLFPPYTWHFAARATTDLEVLAWDTQQLRAKAERVPRFGYDLASRLAKVLLQRLNAIHKQLVEFYAPQP